MCFDFGWNDVGFRWECKKLSDLLELERNKSIVKTPIVINWKWKELLDGMVQLSKKHQHIVKLNYFLIPKVLKWDKPHSGLHIWLQDENESQNLSSKIIGD